MPTLDFTNPLHTFNSVLTYTATGECYLVGGLSSSGAITINGSIGTSTTSSQGEYIPPLKLSAGDTVKVTVTCPRLSVVKIKE
jgi:hypothetical protein